MKTAKTAFRGVQNEKRYPTTTNRQSTKFERLLKPFKGYVFGRFEGDFSVFAKGEENA